jgi:sporulation protein YlmC with PRC-barrel domain
MSEKPTTPPPDPQVRIAWKAIEPGAPVFSAEGEAVGKVSNVVGDTNADVFTGLAISIHTFGSDRFVESERVRGIYPDRIDLALTKAEIERLPEHTDPPAVRWRPGDRAGGFFSRLFRR